MTNFQRTANWLRACGRRPGDDPSAQIGCAIEEFSELVGQLSTGDALVARKLIEASLMLTELGNILKKNPGSVYIHERFRVDALDALCDIEVTLNGIAYMCSMNKELADLAVLASNDSKLEDGKAVILEGGKIGKGRDYQPPDLKPYV